EPQWCHPDQEHALRCCYPLPNPLTNPRGTFDRHQTDPLTAGQAVNVCAQRAALLRAKIVVAAQTPLRCIAATLDKCATTNGSFQTGNVKAPRLRPTPNGTSATKRSKASCYLWRR